MPADPNVDETARTIAWIGVGTGLFSLGISAVQLVLSRLDKRTKLRVQLSLVRLGMSPDDPNPKPYKLNITAANIRGPAVTLARLAFTARGLPRGRFLRTSGRHSLPAVLDPGMEKRLEVGIGGVADALGEESLTGNVCIRARIEDASGKKHWTNWVAFDLATTE
ncbi:MAG: hypothetical protein ACR2HJ_11970 [Fimbriimonadales bacterium]